MHTELVRFFYYTLTGDQELNTAFGNKPEWVYYEQAPVEPSLPFLIHAVTEGGYQNEHSLIDGRWEVSVYTGESNTSINRNITDLLKRKFGNNIFRNVYGLPVVQTWLAPGARFISTGNERVKRFDMTFDIRYTRTY